MCNGNKVKRRRRRYRECEMRGNWAQRCSPQPRWILGYVRRVRREGQERRQVYYWLGSVLFAFSIYPVPQEYLVCSYCRTGQWASCTLVLGVSGVLRSELMMSCGDAFGSDCEWPEDHSGTRVRWERVSAVRLLNYRYNRHKVYRFQPRLIDE